MNRSKLLFLISAIALGLAGCSGEKTQLAAKPETVRNVAVLSVQSANLPDVFEAVGTVRADQTSVLASQMMGNIVEIRVREGDRVQRGEVLALIDATQPRASLDRATAALSASQQQLVAAESDLALAESTLKRYQTLYERKSVSPQEFDEVKARQQAALARRDMAQAEQAQAKAALLQAQSAFEYTRIRAPFDGIVTEKKADTGMLASPGTPILTVEDVVHHRLEATINESDLRYVRIGQPAPVFIDALGDVPRQGKIAEIVPAADPASRTFLLKLSLPIDNRLRSGLFGHAQFPRGERTSLLIPRSAIIERGQLRGVLVLDDNLVASLRYVTLGKAAGEQIEVLAGLQGGEHLVAAPDGRELDGKRIEAQP